MTKSQRSVCLDRFDILSKFWIGFGGLALSSAIGFSTIYYNRQATERQANAQIEALALQRRSSAAQVEVSLMPVFARGTNAERQLALSILASVAPDEGERIGATLLSQFKSDAQREDASAVISTVSETKRKQKVQSDLQNAAVYRQFSLDASACRAYFAAFESLSAAEKKQVTPEIDLARAEYSRGKFNEAANRLQAALDLK